MTGSDHRPPRPDRAIVVGLGSIDRGDDAVGSVVAGMVRADVTAHGPDGIHVIEHEDPATLIDLMADFGVVVIVDATRSGAPAGTVTVRDVGQGEPALPIRALPAPAGTHGLGLASAIELARALDRLPDRVVVVGIEAARFDHGRALSAPVASAVTAAVGVILDILRISAPRS